MNTHANIREVSLRDGLQIEKPIPLSAKLELLAAVAAWAAEILLPTGALLRVSPQADPQWLGQLLATVGQS